MIDYIDLNRKFWPVEADKENDPENIRILSSFGVEKEYSWDDLFKKDRVVILAEPGTGKTSEFYEATQKLRKENKLTFFYRIEMLNEIDIHSAIEIGSSKELDDWRSGAEIAYFFLDSVDEARLTRRNAYELALNHFSSAIVNNLDRAKIFISCRVSNWRATADLNLFLRYFSKIKSEDDEEGEDNISTNIGHINRTRGSQNHVVFQLAPLDNQQIKKFASYKGIENTSSFIEAIERSDAQIFAERPQDLLDLISFWKSNNQLGSHYEMLEFNIQKKLIEMDPNRDEARPLSPEDALFGAERLAAAVTLLKKNYFLLPDIPIDYELDNISISPKEALPEWASDKIQILLDRPIFDVAIYGTVKFHERSVREYLAASWVRRLINLGRSRRFIEGIIFNEKYGIEVVIPSMRPVAAWIALWDDGIKNKIRKIAPEVLIEHGDPSSLPVEFRKSLLVEFAEYYADREYTGTSFDVSMVRRLADPSLSSTVNKLLKKYRNNDDICSLLLKIIWQGKISDSTQMVMAIVSDNKINYYNRVLALRAVAVNGTKSQKQMLVRSILKDISNLDSAIVKEICSLYFPDTLTIPQLLRIFEVSKSPEEFSSSLQYSIEKIVDNTDISENDTIKLIQGLYILLKSQPFVNMHHCDISDRYIWLLPIAIRLSNKLIRQRGKYSFDTVVLDLFLNFIIAQHYNSHYIHDLDKLLEDVKAWEGFRYKLFWYAIEIERNREKDTDKHPTHWRWVSWEINNFWVPIKDNLEILFDDFLKRNEIPDKLIILSAIFQVYVNEKKPRKLRERIRRAVKGIPALEKEFENYLHPKLTEEQKKWRQDEKTRKQCQKRTEKQQDINRRGWAKILKENPDVIKNIGNAPQGEKWNWVVYLYERLKELNKESGHSLGYSNWRSLEKEFGIDVAKNFRDSCVAFWREYDPFTVKDRRTSSTILLPRIIGLTGLSIESHDDPKWVTKLTVEEAEISVHYSLCDLSNLPSWFSDLQTAFSDIVQKVIEGELQYEFNCSETENHSHTLSALLYSKDIKCRYPDIIFNLILEKEPVNDTVLDNAISIILMTQRDADINKKLIGLAYNRFKAAKEKNRKITWLIILFYIGGLKGCTALEKWIKSITNKKERIETMINFCSAFTNHGNSRFSAPYRDYERIEVLKELVPFVYDFIKIEDDNPQRTGVYTPNQRDHAQEARSHLLELVYKTPGKTSYDILVHLSKISKNRHLKDRMHFLAKERAAIDSEYEPWNVKSIVEFSISHLTTPRTESDLFNMALNQLDDLKHDIEDGDESEAVLLKRLTNETEIRTVFANRLRKASRSLYTIGSEEEFADAARTDIRFNAPLVTAPVPVELKIADKWSHKELIERLENQLIRQYMRISQYGIFLIVYNGMKKSNWRNVHNNKSLTFLDLVNVLKEDLVQILHSYQNIQKIDIIGIDFTVRVK
jgi:hypothetical protein